MREYFSANYHSFTLIACARRLTMALHCDEQHRSATYLLNLFLRLTGHRCKLVCTHCGYYLSCADYY